MFVRAAELLENHKVTVYCLKDNSRQVIKLTSRRGEHVLLRDVNFCQCDSFKSGVLEGKIVACEHVLAAKLCDHCNYVIVNDLQMKEMLGGLKDCFFF